jgi:hypothetical protein
MLHSPSLRSVKFKKIMVPLAIGAYFRCIAVLIMSVSPSVSEDAATTASGVCVANAHHHHHHHYL